MNEKHETIMNDWLILDLETTSVDRQRGGIHELHAVHGASGERFDVLFRPHLGCVLEPAALAKCGVSVARLEIRQNEAEALKLFATWYDTVRGGRVLRLAGHNVDFDRDFLLAAWRRVFGDLTFPFRHRLVSLGDRYEVLCHLKGRSLAAGGFNLDEIRVGLGLPPEGNDHAGGRGALYTFEAFQALEREFGVLASDLVELDDLREERDERDGSDLKGGAR